ncbi:MAG: hypothetical protein ACHQAZ_07090 [Gammaproteobacteria bacterium]|jgi:hypothetical protein|nr:hypothetical protein [Gammaproteobacteria bacterium]
MQDQKDKQHMEDALDEALRGTFPASDPVAIHAPLIAGKPKRRAKKPVSRKKIGKKKKPARKASRPTRKKPKKTRRR